MLCLPVLPLADCGENHQLLLWTILLVLLLGLLAYLGRTRQLLEKKTASLLKSEKHLRTLGENLTGTAFFQLSHHAATNRFEFSFISANFNQVLGLGHETAYDQAEPMLESVYEEDIPRLRKAYAEASAALEPLKVDIRALDSKGAYKWLHICAIPQRTNALLVWDGIIQDISTAKETEQTMLEESRNFQNLFGTIEDFLVVCDMDGRILHTNPSVERRLGFSRDELAEMSLFELFAIESRVEIYQLVAKLHSEPNAVCRHPFQTKHDSLIPVETHLLQGIWKHGAAIFCIARDVVRYQQTEAALRKSQQMLQLIIDTIPMSIFWKDKDSVYLGCNRAFIRECSLDATEEVVGKTPHDLFDASVEPVIIARDQSVMERNESLINHLESHTQPDGSIGWREVSLIPLRDEEGRAVGVLGVWRDVTEQNRAEERLKRTLEDMERFNQLMRGRERRTLELKAEINELLEELGKPKKYRTTLEDVS